MPTCAKRGLSPGGGRRLPIECMKGALDSNGIDSRRIQVITDGLIEFDTEGGERYRVIIRPNVLLKVCGPVRPNDFPVGIDTCLSEKNQDWFRSIVYNW